MCYLFFYFFRRKEQYKRKKNKKKMSTVYEDIDEYEMIVSKKHHT